MRTNAVMQGPRSALARTNPIPRRALALALLAAFLTAGCGSDSNARDGESTNQMDRAGADGAPAPTNRVPIDAARRRSLGLTFATVARRPIGRAWTLPGEFELAPDAVRAYHAQLSGRVELLVDEFDQVAVGDPIYSLDSPDWREIQHELSEALGAINRAEGELAGARAGLEESRTKVASLASRLDALRELDVRRADLEAELATAQVTQVRQETFVETARSARTLALEHYEGTLNRAASIVDIDADELDVVASSEGGPPTHAWWTIDRVVVRARDAGLVEHLHVTPGAWVAAGDPLVATLRPERLRFRARVTADDLPAVLDGIAGRILRARSGDANPVSVDRLARAPRADELTRRGRVVALEFDSAPWMRAGASAWLELFDAQAPTVLAVPRDAIQRDGLTEVLFRRNPQDPDEAIRVEADLGAADDIWVELRSGVRAGDEVVLDGAWELALESSLSGVDTAGGHFHTDGTFHAGEHEDE